MTLNPFFLQGSQGEQRLVQDLINEQLRIFGVEVAYIPRKVLAEQKLYGTTDLSIDLREIQFSKFDDNFLIEAYVNNYEGYGGAGDILTKFGMSLRDELTITISKERYEDFIAPFMDAFPDSQIEPETVLRPREGDLVYFPLGQRLFEVKFVEHEAPFYQLGKGYVYELKCELYEYEDEIVDTSINEIDEILEDEGYITTLRLVGLGETAMISANSTSGGYVRRLYLNNDGSGYTSVPTVSFTASPTSNTATAVAITTNRGGVYSISEILFTNVGSGYTVPPTITISGGNGVGAAATCDIETGYVGVSNISINDSGEGYPTVPKVYAASPTGTAAQATASIANGEVGIVTITNGGTYYNPNKNIVVSFSAPTGVGSTATGYAVVGSSGTVTSVVVSFAGTGYTSEPTVSIGSSFSDKVGLNTAVLKATINAFDRIAAVRIVDPGNGYVGVITAWVASPPRISGIGTYIFNEEVIGEQSRVSARVKDWTFGTKTLKVGINTGVFYEGEEVVGTASSARYVVSSYDTEDPYDPYAQNDQIEEISDKILDFSESNPFGSY